MKILFKIFCVLLFVCFINVNIVNADNKDSEKLWRCFQNKRDNIITKVISDEGAEVKGVYFSSSFDANEDERYWQDGDLLVKMDINKKQLHSILENVVKKIWYGERWNRDLDKEPLTDEEMQEKNKNKMDEMEKYVYNCFGMSTKQEIYSRYRGGMTVTVKDSVDEEIIDGKLTVHGGDFETLEELVTTKVLDDKYNLYYSGEVYRRGYENITNAVAGENKIRINSEEYKLASSNVLKNGSMYIPEDGARIILNKYKKQITNDLEFVNINGINYYSYRNLINLCEDNVNQIYFDIDTKMASSITIDLNEAQRTLYGYFYS